MPPASNKRQRAKSDQVPERGARGPASMAVRMLVGPYAGRVVNVPREEGVRLCSGWQPQAEPAPSAPVDRRETRKA